MDLLEYQAKQLFAQVEIPVLPSQSIFTPSDLKNLHIPYPVVLKSQVLASERNKFGGVRFVENTIDAIAVAQSLFNLPIKGEYPQVILAEAHYDVENELFLGVIVDYALKKPVLLGSAYGGVDLELLLKNLQTCVIEEEFSPFYARYLATKMGLTGNALAPIVNILEKMYDLLATYDLDLIEINPLGINQNGEVMALDGKIRVNEHALNRHPHLFEYLNLKINQNIKTDNQSNNNIFLTKRESYQPLKLDPNSNLVVITDNIDETIFIINTLKQHQQTINTCYILPERNKQFWMNNIYNLFLKIIKLNNIKNVFINHSNKDKMIDILQEKIATYYQQQTQKNNLASQEREERPTGMRLWEQQEYKTVDLSVSWREINWIIRNLSMSINQEETQFQELPIHLIASLEKAINLIISPHGSCTK